MNDSIRVLAELRRALNEQDDGANSIRSALNTSGSHKGKHQRLKVAVDALQKVAEADPENKPIATMLARLQKMLDLENKKWVKANKGVSKLAEKAIPPKFKKFVASSKRKIRAMLTNPNDLELMVWPEYNGYSATFTVPGQKYSYGTAKRLTLNVSTNAADNGYMGIGQYRHQGYVETSNANDVAAKFAEIFAGWEGLKGEGDRSDNRNAAKDNVMRVMNRVVARLSSWGDLDEATFDQSNLTITAAYRSDLPKEGATSVGEYEYDEMVNREIAKAEDVLGKELEPYKDAILKVDIHDSEKSWIYFTVRLK